MLIEVLLAGNCVFAQELDTLSPQIQINSSIVQYLFSFYTFPSGNTLTTTVDTEDYAGQTKMIVIENQDSGFASIIKILSFEKNRAYKNWLVAQYEERTLANYPYIATKTIINAMVAKQDVFKNAVVLDAGSGDGVLSILSKKLGAEQVYGIEWNKPIMPIAKNNAALNHFTDIEFIQGNFRSKHKVIKKDPTVLIFNTGYVNDDLNVILENYPSIQYVFVTTRNVHAPGHDKDFLSDLNRVKALGEITESFYHRQAIYSMDAFDEGYWGFAVDLRKQESGLQTEDEEKMKVEDLSKKLGELGFRYADKLSPKFELPLKNKYGELKMLLVTKKGDPAIALRETLHFGMGRGLSFRMINLMEINPFLGDIGREEKIGYCQFAIDTTKKQASLSLNNDTIVKTDYHRNEGLASAMLSLAISLSKKAKMKKITVFNVRKKRARSLYLKLGFSPTSETSMVLDLEKDPKSEQDGTGSWRMDDVAKHRKFRFLDIAGEQERIASFVKDLDSQDAEVRLHAALVLHEKGIGDSRVYKIIKQSSFNQELTLSERVRAQEKLIPGDLSEHRHTIRSDQDQFSRIEEGDREDFTSLDLKRVTMEEVRSQIRALTGLTSKEADLLIKQLDKIDFLNNELSRLSNAIRYFNGDWYELLHEKVLREYGYEFDGINTIINNEISDGPFFKTLDYVKAFLVSQDLASRLRSEGITLMSGDMEWLLLEAFKNIHKNGYALRQTENILENKWKLSTASSRAMEIFVNLREIGLFQTGFISEVEIEFLANTAQQFIYRGYDDANHLEYASGPNYDQRNISIGVENNIDSVNALHINLGVPWASKYIWASYLAMHEFINVDSFMKGSYDYFYDQQIKESTQLFEGQRRVSYIGVWTKRIKDIKQIIDIFVPLSSALNFQISGDNLELAGIWREFRTEFENSIDLQDDEQLKTEFFEQARMVRFVELISENNRNNAFYRQIKKLVQKTVFKINDIIEGKDEYKEQTLFTKVSLAKKLKPITNKNQPSIHNEIIMEGIDSTVHAFAVSGSNLLIRNNLNRKNILITLIAKMIPTSGNTKPSVERKKSFIYIGDKSYEVVADGITDESTFEKFEFSRNADGILYIDLSKVSGNSQLDAFMDMTSDRDNTLRRLVNNRYDTWDQLILKNLKRVVNENVQAAGVIGIAFPYQNKVKAQDYVLIPERFYHVTKVSDILGILTSKKIEARQSVTEKGAFVSQPMILKNNPDALSGFSPEFNGNIVAIEFGAAEVQDQDRDRRLPPSDDMKNRAWWVFPQGIDLKQVKNLRVVVKDRRGIAEIKRMLQGNGMNIEIICKDDLANEIKLTVSAIKKAKQEESASSENKNTLLSVSDSSVAIPLTQNFRLHYAVIQQSI